MPIKYDDNGIQVIYGEFSKVSILFDMFATKIEDAFYSNNPDEDIYKLRTQFSRYIFPKEYEDLNLEGMSNDEIIEWGMRRLIENPKESGEIISRASRKIWDTLTMSQEERDRTTQLTDTLSYMGEIIYKNLTERLDDSHKELEYKERQGKVNEKISEKHYQGLDKLLQDLPTSQIIFQSQYGRSYVYSVPTNSLKIDASQNNLSTEINL